MAPQIEETRRSGEATGSKQSASTPNNRQDTIEYAVSTLGDLLNLAFDDARRLDQYGRHVVSAFGDIDHGQRIALGDQHPGLVEALLLLENQIGRMDQRAEWP